MNELIKYSNSLLGEEYYKVMHKSGMPIFIYPKERQSSCAIFSTGFGSINSNFYDKKSGKFVKLPDGIAHFMEHKMFDNENGDSVDDIFSRLGADPNAYTSWDHTAYFFTCTSGDAFYEGLDCLMNFVSTPYFTKESVEKEQGIIGQEIAMCEDDPYDRCFLGMVKGLFERHPVRCDVLGTVESISKITPDVLYKCHEMFYKPSNMALVICGNIDTEKALLVADKYLSHTVSDDEAHVKIPQERITAYQRRVVQRMPVERPMFCIGFKDSKASSDPILRRKRQILTEILIGATFSSSGELYTSLFNRNIMTTPFNYGEEYGETYALGYVGGECDDVELLFGEIKKYIKKLRKNGLKKEDFERRKKIILSSDIKMYDSTWEIANALLDSHMSGTDLFDDPEILMSLTVDDANELIKELLCEKRTTYSVVLPN